MLKPVVHWFPAFHHPPLSLVLTIYDLPLSQLFQLTAAILQLGVTPLSDPHNLYCRHPSKCQTEPLSVIILILWLAMILPYIAIWAKIKAVLKKEKINHEHLNITPLEA